MLGYVTLDVSASYVPTNVASALYVTYAAVFVLDAIFYFMGWLITDALQKKNQDNATRIIWNSSLWGEVNNIVGSIIYLISSTLVYLPSNGTIGQLVVSRGLSASLNLVAMSIYVLDSFMYYVGWRDTVATGNTVGSLKDVYFWGALFNIIPSLGYLASSLYLTISLNILFSADASGLEGAMATIASLQATYQTYYHINAANDFLFLIDAIIYFIAWIVDVVNQRAQSGQQNVVVKLANIN